MGSNIKEVKPRKKLYADGLTCQQRCHKRKKALGICVSCSQPAEPTKTRCKAHLDIQAVYRESYSPNPVSTRRYYLKYQFGITPEYVEEMRVKQASKCAICLEEFTSTPHIDHCHTSNKIRALLCGQCNAGLGYFKETPTALRSAANYLEYHACKLSNLES